MDQLSDSDFWIRVIMFILIVSSAANVGLAWWKIRRKEELPYRPLQAINERK